MLPSVTFKNVRITHSYIIYLVAGMAQRDWLRAAGRQQASHLLKADCVCCNENYFSVSIHHIHSCSTLMECSWQLHYTGVVCYEVEI